MPYVGLVYCWFSPLLREGFLRVLWFSHLFKTQHFQNQVEEEPLCGYATVPPNRYSIILNIIYLFKHYCTSKYLLCHMLLAPFKPAKETLFTKLQYGMRKGCKLCKMRNSPFLPQS